ncbi:ABC-three component system protein [Asticcacaulis sp.]|uniref:ABC-three component system protein n=1 Tax=Asticcacaulis sp. TaxID=1872648 RepID=UPI002C1DEE4A|nr:ABC-three component system protein [Asticcacaulis sp.]HTM81938.1 ABC-three component system protein [Asticcacaulis sp.]
MKYAYEDLSPEQFEHLIVLVCQHLLGVSVKGFATGPDGGRDAKFHGTAELHPSTAKPWSGKVIVQAKHSNGYNRSFSETDFYREGGDSTVIGKEVPRIQALRIAKDLDHYMLFSNRRLTAGADADITKHIAQNTGLDESSVYLCGIETIEMLLKRFPQIASMAELDPIDSPLIVSSEELAIVVEAFARHRSVVGEAFDPPPTARTSYEEKNQLNNMSEDYAKDLRRKFLKETAQIKSFLGDPENLDILESYEATTEEFQGRIIAHRKDHQNFDAVMEYLLGLLFDRDAVLRQTKHKRLTRALLFYMYWNCDIGLSGDAEAE